jgi:uncharacterized membrane protein
VFRTKLSKQAQQQMKAAQLARCRNPNLADVVERNIAAIIEMREQFEASKTRQDRMADALTAFSGSLTFVYLHAIWFGLWVVLNIGWLKIKPFDPYPFGLLTMVVSLEAIFLSTFVLVSQNRMGAVADRRADLDLQINLLSEHEVTRLLTLVDAIADHLGLSVGEDSEVDELKRDTAPEMVLEEIAAREHERPRRK